MHIKVALLLVTMIFNEYTVSISLGNVTTANYEEKKDDKDSSRASYEGYQLWKIETDSPNKLKVAKNLDIIEVTRWGVNGTNSDILISAKNLDKIRNELDKNNVDYQVLIQDLQKEIDKHTIIDTEGMKLTQKIETFNLSSYHQLPVIYNYLYMLSRQHHHVKLKTIGKTGQGNKIQVVRIATRKGNKNGIFVEAGIHAREWISPATALYLISQFAYHFEEESHIIQNLDWYFLPVTNPDGYVYSYSSDRLWRKNRHEWGNCIGTDLNRNFGYHWDHGDPNPCNETFSGPAPFSESETVAVRDFVTKFDSTYWKAYISIHSYGQYILHPFGYDRVVPNNINQLITTAQIATDAIKGRYGTEYTISSSADIYIAAGVSTDWASSLGIRYSYTIELRDKGEHAFLLPPEYIIPTGKELLLAVRVIAEEASRDVTKK